MGWPVGKAILGRFAVRIRIWLKKFNQYVSEISDFLPKYHRNCEPTLPSYIVPEPNMLACATGITQVANAHRYAHSTWLSQTDRQPPMLNALHPYSYEHLRVSKLINSDIHIITCHERMESFIFSEINLNNMNICPCLINLKLHCNSVVIPLKDAGITSHLWTVVATQLKTRFIFSYWMLRTHDNEDFCKSTLC